MIFLQLNVKKKVKYIDELENIILKKNCPINQNSIKGSKKIFSNHIVLR